MNFKSQLELAVQTYQPKVEQIMNVELGEVTIKDPLIIQRYYHYTNYIKELVQNKQLTHQNKIQLFLQATRLTIDELDSTASIRSNDKSSTIYLGRIGITQKIIDECTEYIACHELTHLAHKQIIGTNLLKFWDREETENIADYVAIQIIMCDEKREISSLMLRRLEPSIVAFTKEMRDKHNRNITKYISERKEQYEKTYNLSTSRKTY